MSPVQGESPLVQVKEPYGNFDMVTCRLYPAIQSVQSTPADNIRKRVWQYIEKERKKERLFRFSCISIYGIIHWNENACFGILLLFIMKLGELNYTPIKLVITIKMVV